MLGGGGGQNYAGAGRLSTIQDDPADRKKVKPDKGLRRCVMEKRGISGQ